MSLHPEPIGEVPAETARVARAAFPKGTVVTRLRDEFGILYEAEDFRRLHPARGQPGLAPWRLAPVTVFQVLEHLSDRQAGDAVRARIDWIRGACTAVQPPVDEGELRHAIGALQRIAEGA